MNAAMKFPRIDKKPDYAPMGATAGHEGSPPEFMEARDILSVDKLTGQRVREKVDGPMNVSVDRIEWLFAHKRITERQHAAANRLQKDWQLSQIAPCATSLIAGGGSARADYTPADAKIAAMKRHGEAMASLGRWLGIVELIVLQNFSIEKAATFCGGIHHQRAAERLETGLDMLADHYRIPATTY